MTAVTPVTVDLTTSQRELQQRLVLAIRKVIPIEAELDHTRQRAHCCYEEIATLLVELRHTFPGPNGEEHDLRGRSLGYRIAVREAYAGAGIDTDAPIPKRLTAGVAYWVRKQLVERYGQEELRELGVLRGALESAHRPHTKDIDELPDDPALCLNRVVEVLNALAIDPGLVPSEDAVRSALRAVLLLRNKVAGRCPPSAATDHRDGPDPLCQPDALAPEPPLLRGLPAPDPRAASRHGQPDTRSVQPGPATSLRSGAGV